ncbi:hypothetical protein H5410_029183 [Solanum commersonii]|uniref:Uncharacterized protein n=1 Tax=Solanum commersonii TaxID=4109 RepID=A0A9J5Z3Y9_SOLCO|nr:hypothetical protein H5410_029183 [Solanum commersonii]
MLCLDRTSCEQLHSIRLETDLGFELYDIKVRGALENMKRKLVRSMNSSSSCLNTEKIDVQHPDKELIEDDLQT